MTTKKIGDTRRSTIVRSYFQITSQLGTPGIEIDGSHWSQGLPDFENGKSVLEFRQLFGYCLFFKTITVAYLVGKLMLKANEKKILWFP